MEGKEGTNSLGITASESNPVVAPMVENSAQFSGSTMSIVEATPISVTVPAIGTEEKKRRGRPRKYGPDGTVMEPLSPMPISASIPLSGDFPAWKPSSKGRPMDSFKKKPKLKYEGSGERVAYYVGANFTPHVITVNAGEDVMMKILSLSQQESRAICIIAANGAISNVTLRQPHSLGGTFTYEGLFEILSLSGSFMPTDNEGTKARTGGISVSLSGADGRIVGGGLGGLLVAAGPVQVMVGSFLAGHQQEKKPKKQKYEPASTFASPPAATFISGNGTDVGFTVTNLPEHG